MVHIPTLGVTKASDETVNNSDTLQDDDDLVLPVDANSTYMFILAGSFVTNGTADFHIGWTGPASATMAWNETLSSSAAARAIGASPIVQGSTADETIFVLGWLKTVGTAGNLQLQWAQGTATVVDTKLRAGSSLIAIKVG